MGTLAGKVAVVTGGGSGIGEAVCRRFAREGASVAVLDMAENAARLTAELCGGIPLVADVASSRSVEAALRQAEATLGPVDIWVNNAGHGLGATGPQVNQRMRRQLEEAAAGAISTPLDALVQIDDEEWGRMIAVHLSGTFFGSRAAARSMVKRRSGAIVNVASICGIQGCTGHPHYSAAKAGIMGFTRAVGKELVQQGIRVNCVAPGTIDTPMVQASLAGPLLEATRLSIPQGRLGLPHEIAAAVAFLASEDASYFVGQTLSPNGGAVTYF